MNYSKEDNPASTLQSFNRTISNAPRSDFTAKVSLNALFTTTDLMLSAYLKYKGLELVAVKKDSFSGRFYFRFKDSLERPRFIGEFYGRGPTPGLVDVSKYYGCLLELKTILSSGGQI